MPAAGETIKAYVETDTYVPALTSSGTNPTLGTGAVQDGWWHRNGQLITCGGIIQFGTSPTSGTGTTFLVSLPFPANTSLVAAGTGVGLCHIGGSAMMRRNSPLSNSVNAVPLLRTGGTNIWFRNVTSTGNDSTGPVPPWGGSWAAGDAIDWLFIYPADPSVL